MIKLAHRVGLPFLRADAAFSKDSNMNKKSYLAGVRLPRTPADWLDDEFHLLPVRHAGGGLRGAHHVYMVLSGVPAIHKIGLFRFLLGTEWASTAADPKFGILPYPVQCVRYAGCHPHRRARRPAHGGVPVQGGRPKGAHGGGHGH